MKKLSLILLGALAVTQAAQAAPASFNGFYVGGQLGWTQRKDTTNIPAIQDTITGVPGGNVVIRNAALNKAKKANGLTYGIYSGYGQNNNGFYWGGEFSIEHTTANKNTTYAQEPTATQGANTVKGSFNINSKYERGVVFGITPRIGAVIANENLIYAKLGLEFSRDKATIGHTDVMFAGNKLQSASTSTKSKNQVVLVPRFGYERAFGNVLARAEYGYNVGGKIKSKDVSVKYTAHVVKFGLAYKF